MSRRGARVLFSLLVDTPASGTGLLLFCRHERAKFERSIATESILEV